MDDPIVGIVMLILGMALGFFIQPEFSGSQAAAYQPAWTGQPAQRQPGDLFIANANRDPQGMMNKSVPLVRHWRGDPSAPIRLVEFGDYQ